MAGSPTNKRVEEVLANASVAIGPSTTTVTLARQVGPAGFLPPGPFNQDPGSAFTPTFPVGNTISAPRGTVFPNLLSTPAEDYTTQAGVVSAGFSSGVSLAAVFLQKIQFVDFSGNLISTIFSDAVGLSLTDGSIPGLLGRIACEGGHQLQLVLNYPSGSAITITAKARYDLGFNAQQPEVFSTPASI
jgi:hypothetical protein